MKPLFLKRKRLNPKFEEKKNDISSFHNFEHLNFDNENIINLYNEYQKKEAERLSLLLFHEEEYENAEKFNTIEQTPRNSEYAINSNSNKKKNEAFFSEKLSIGSKNNDNRLSTSVSRKIMRNSTFEKSSPKFAESLRINDFKKNIVECNQMLIDINDKLKHKINPKLLKKLTKEKSLIDHNS